MSRFDRRAARGADLITRDTHGTAWVDQIDIGGLDLASDHYCVLGQVYRPGGPFNLRAYGRNGYTYALNHFRRKRFIHCGFLTISPLYSLWRQRRAWVKLLTKMKEERKAERDMSQRRYLNRTTRLAGEPLRSYRIESHKELTKV